MRAIFSETGKIWRSKLFLGVLVCLLGVNLFCLNHSVHSKMYSPQEYRLLWDEICKQPMGERLSYAKQKQEALYEQLRASGQFLSRESFLYDDIVSELEAANSYETFLADLEQKKKLISGSVLFRDVNSYSKQSAQKAYEEYRDTDIPVIDEAPSKGIELISFSFSDLLAACAGIFACVVLFVREREQDMVRLQWTLKRGRLWHLMYKLAALFLSSIGISVLFYGCNYVFASLSYGLGPLSRDIRMVEEYAHSIHGFRVAVWLGVNLLLKILVLFIMLLLCSVCCTLLSGMVSVVLSFSGVLLTEYLLYSKISATSVYSPLRNVNLMALFRNDEWLLCYKHINVFGNPVNYVVCAMVLLMLLFIGGLFVVGLGYIGYGKKLEHRSGTKRIKRNKKQHTTTKLLSLELWKVLVMQRMLPVIIGFLLFQIVFYMRADTPGVSIEEYYYRAYMTRLEGEVTDETPMILEEIYLEALKAQNSMAMDAYEQVRERYDYLKERGGCFVYDTGFGVLCDAVQMDKDAELTLKIMLVVLMFSAAVFSYDPQKRMDGLLHSTVKGAKQVPVRKYLICAIISILTAVAVYLPDFLLVTKQYTVHGYDYPAISLPWLSQYGEGLSIGGYLILLYLTRILFCPVVVLFVQCVAEHVKSFVYTFFVCGMIMLCIPLLNIMNPVWKRVAYPLYGIYGNWLLQSSWLELLLYVAFVIGAVVLLIRGRRKQWN